MITRDGYSKDPFIQPTGIVITFAKEMMLETGGVKAWLKYFNEVMSKHEQQWTWLARMKNAPKQDIIHVYIIVLNRLYGRCIYGGHEAGETTVYKPLETGEEYLTDIKWPRIVLSGPFERCPFKRELKGFQGFRYCEDLF